jgi:hypothetical protein
MRFIALILASASLAACTSLPPDARGQSRLAPVHYLLVDDCVRTPFPQCSGGN